jgi:hypothetical protein
LESDPNYSLTAGPGHHRCRGAGRLRRERCRSFIGWWLYPQGTVFSRNIGYAYGSWINTLAPTQWFQEMKKGFNSLHCFGGRQIT